MKKYLKCILLMCLVAVVLFSLCSCNMLDELKNKHVIYDKDNPETVKYRGEKYVRMTLEPHVWFNLYMAEMMYVEAEGFPLLLLGYFGNLSDFGGFCYYSEDKEVIKISLNGLDTFYYAHEDKADEYRKIIEKNDLSYLKFDYYEYDQTLQRSVEKSYILEEELITLINERATSDGVYEINSDEIRYRLELKRCDETNLLESEENAITIIQRKNGNFFVKKGTLKYGDKLEGAWVSTDDINDFVKLMDIAKRNGAEDFIEYYN